jgi:hypothetical protein
VTGTASALYFGQMARWKVTSHEPFRAFHRLNGRI